MQNSFFLLSPTAAAFFSSMLFFGDTGSAAAVIFAAAVHELSHIAVLLACGFRIAGFDMGATGVCIKYVGKENRRARFLSNMAGPAGGMALYYFGKAALSASLPQWLHLSCRVSLFLSLFNLIPAFPLDGGYCAYIIAGRLFGGRYAGTLMKFLGRFFSVLIILAGLAFIANGFGIGAMIAGISILCANVPSDDL